MTNRLFGMRTYLVGAMDRVEDGGTEWREYIEPLLNELGVVVFNPCDKCIDIGAENDEGRKLREESKKVGVYHPVCDAMKEIRNVDLRMVDISDFLIVNLDLDVHACGTYEEITTANRQKKPIVVRIKQGKLHTPDWLLGMLGSSHDMIFNTWDGVMDYLKTVNNCHADTIESINSHKRWTFFDLKQIYGNAVSSFAAQNSLSIDEVFANHLIDSGV